VGSRLLLVLNHVLGAKKLAVVAQVLVQLLRRVRQDGRKDGFQVVDGAQDDVDRCCCSSPVLLDLEPGRLAIQVAVGLAGQGQGFTQRRAEPTGVVMFLSTENRAI
jgi:hypothetical protein